MMMDRSMMQAGITTLGTCCGSLFLQGPSRHGRRTTTSDFGPLGGLQPLHTARERSETTCLPHNLSVSFFFSFFSCPSLQVYLSKYYLSISLLLWVSRSVSLSLAIVTQHRSLRSLTSFFFFYLHNQQDSLSSNGRYVRSPDTCKELPAATSCQ